MSLDEMHFMITFMKMDEYKKLLDDRRLLNHRIEQGLASREELLKQIKAEINLLDRCQLKIDEKINENNKYDMDDHRAFYILANRINSLYKKVFQHNPIEKTILSEYVDFCSIYKLFKTKCNHTLETVMLKYHSDPQLYIIAASYEFDDRHDIEMARKYFAEGLKYHKNCRTLYVEEFWIEVQHLEKNPGASSSIAVQKYRNFIKLFEGDMEFHFMLLDKAIRLKSVGDLQSYVARDMIKKYRHSELMWQKLAKINFDGFIHDYDTGVLHYEKDYNTCIRVCIQTYEDGLKENLPLESKHNLWNFYIDHIIEIRDSYRMKKEIIRNFMNETMDRVFQEAHDNGVLRKAEYYIYWSHHTKKGSTTEILNAALEVNKDRAELWTELLGYYVYYNNLKKAIDIFQIGVYHVKSNSLSLWLIMELYLKYTHPKLLQVLYQDGIRFPYEQINSIMSIKYLDWCVLHNDILSARELFSDLNNSRSKELYSTMIQFEKSQKSLITNLDFIRKLYNDACITFGKKDIELWIDYIRFEYTFGSPLLVNQIYTKSFEILSQCRKKGMTMGFVKLRNEFKKDELNNSIACIEDDDDPDDKDRLVIDVDDDPDDKDRLVIDVDDDPDDKDRLVIDVNDDPDDKDRLVIDVNDDPDDKDRLVIDVNDDPSDGSVIVVEDNDDPSDGSVIVVEDDDDPSDGSVIVVEDDDDNQYCS